MTVAWRTPRLVPRDVEVLEQRARDLASGVEEGAGDAARLRLVEFRLAGGACGIEARAVEHAVSRLSGAVAVPMSDGTERAVAFVNERPVPVADLAGTLAGKGRSAAELSGAAALVVASPRGPVAVVVEGPLELAEAAMVAAAPGEAAQAADGPRLAGRLADGTSLLDPEWLAAWAGRAVAP
ncbi:MAG TPA: hypothetical protein VLU43_05500 [Anaeromyxobacteraceae bacterium]|nr:hypothetical protein [Anaeromyxobacteraceae bacterium]